MAKRTRKQNEDVAQTIDLSNAEFQNVDRLINYTCQSIFLTGKAGTGKSTFLRYITKTTTKKFVVLAPTGIAAVNVGGQTLHSFFKIPFKPILPDDPDFAISRLRKRMKYSHELIKLIKELELIIIDEISMVRADIIDFIDKILRVYSGNMRVPFGGKQMLFVGDIFQLEPVVTGEMKDILRLRYNHPYFFCARVFDDFSLVPIELRKVYRQNDSEFIEMLDRVRVGHPTANDIARINARVVDESALNKDEMIMTIATRREIVDGINDTRLDALPGKVKEYEGEIKEDFPLSSIPTDMTLELKVGAQVVFIKNDMQHRWVNGSLGRVVELSEDAITVELENKSKHTVERERWSNVKYIYDEERKSVIEEEIGSFTQFPLKLAWALTIHKSQGLTFNNIFIDFGRGAFTGGQSYVALSRCTSLDGIRLMSTINERDVWVHPAIVKFSQTFNDNSLIDDVIEKADASRKYVEASEAFDRNEFRLAVELFAEANRISPEFDKESVRRLVAIKLSAIGNLKSRIADLEDKLNEKEAMLMKVAKQYVSLADQCYTEMEAIDAALSNYDSALELIPELPAALYGKGFVLARTDDKVSAIGYLKRAAVAMPDSYKPAYELGKLFLHTGSITDAVDWLLRALSIDEGIEKVHTTLADAYEQAGDDESAHKHRSIAKKLRNNRKRK
jgi:tetratricopeptide (TPR) repeat protein